MKSRAEGQCFSLGENQEKGFPSRGKYKDAEAGKTLTYSGLMSLDHGKNGALVGGGGT